MDLTLYLVLAGPLVLALATFIGGIRRTQRALIAAFGGVVFPLTWLVWDELDHDYENALRPTLDTPMPRTLSSNPSRPQAALAPIPPRDDHRDDSPPIAMLSLSPSPEANLVARASRAAHRPIRHASRHEPTPLTPCRIAGCRRRSVPRSHRTLAGRQASRQSLRSSACRICRAAAPCGSAPDWHCGIAFRPCRSQMSG
jgi:hypothetical protein